jgi:hypothetical protein
LYEELDEAAEIDHTRDHAYDEARFTCLAATLCRLEGRLGARAKQRARRALVLAGSTGPAAVSAQVELGDAKRAKGPFVAVNCGAITLVWLKASLSVIGAALLQEQNAIVKAWFAPRKAAYCFSTKLQTWRSRYELSCYEYYRKTSSPESFCIHDQYFPRLAVVITAVETQFDKWTNGNATLRRLCSLIISQLFMSRCIALLKERFMPASARKTSRELRGSQKLLRGLAKNGDTPRSAQKKDRMTSTEVGVIMVAIEEGL